ANLGPLRGLPLQQLKISSCPVKDLTPLAEMPLTLLHMDKCFALHDLSPLASLKLVEVRLPPRVTSGLEGLRAMASLQSIDDRSPPAFWRELDAVRPQSKTK